MRHPAFVFLPATLVPVVPLLPFASACSSSSSSPSGETDGGNEAGVEAAGPDAPEAASPDAASNDSGLAACAPTASVTADAGAPNIPPGPTGCVQDIGCPTGQFCSVATMACTSAASAGFSAGNGTGGHAADGGACAPSLALVSCDPTALAWSASVDISRTPGSLVESDAVLAADGHGNIVAAWSTIPHPKANVTQLNQLAVSHDDGTTFTPLTTPTDATTSAANDSVLAYDAQGLWYYVWEGYGNDFKGAQHVWVSTSPDADHWSSASQVDAPGDFQTGGALDFPWVAINPANHHAYVSYEAAPSNSNGSERLVVLDGSVSPDAGAEAGVTSDGGAAPTSLSLTDGARPSVYPDLARGVFDSAGSYYAAWMELGDQNTGVGGTLSGSTQNAIYFTRIDLSGANLVPLASNVKVSGAMDAVNFDGPSIAVTPDGSALYVSYAVGTNNAVDVVVAKSVDRGATWSAAVKVNGDPSCATHYHSGLLLDGKGRLYVFWYDNRDGQGHFFYALSDDEGKTFHDNRLLSAPTFPFDTFQFSTGWLGDYFEPAIAGGKVYALWSDGREADQSHVFFAKATLP